LEKRKQQERDSYDNVCTKPDSLVTKKGTSGQGIGLKANFYKVVARGGTWTLQNYRVDFEPEEELTHVKKTLMRPHQDVLPVFIFDGSNLYSPHMFDEVR